MSSKTRTTCSMYVKNDEKKVRKKGDPSTPSERERGTLRCQVGCKGVENFTLKKTQVSVYK